MDQTPVPSKRLALIERLGNFLPSLKGRVYIDDYLNLKTVYEVLSEDPNNIPSWIQTYPKILHGIIETNTLYIRNPRSRTILETAADLLEEIVNT